MNETIISALRESVRLHYLKYMHVYIDIHYFIHALNRIFKSITKEYLKSNFPFKNNSTAYPNNKFIHVYIACSMISYGIVIYYDKLWSFSECEAFRLLHVVLQL